MAREPLSDPANMDDELRHLVAIVPSPEFEARVRARVAAIETAHTRRLWWLGPTIAAASLVLAVAALTPRSESDADLSLTSFAPPLAALHPAWSSTAVRPAPVSVAPAAPAVIVQRGQATALLQFAALTAAGRIVDGTVPQPVAVAESDEPVVPPLTIEPVSVEPLASPALPGEPK